MAETWIIPTSIEFIDRTTFKAASDCLNETIPYQHCGAMLLITDDGPSREQVEYEYELMENSARTTARPRSMWRQSLHLRAGMGNPPEWSNERGETTLPEILKTVYIDIAKARGRISGEHGIATSANRT